MADSAPKATADKGLGAVLNQRQPVTDETSQEPVAEVTQGDDPVARSDGEIELPARDDNHPARCTRKHPIGRSRPEKDSTVLFVAKVVAGTFLLILVSTLTHYALAFIDYDSVEQCAVHNDAAITRGLIPRRYQEGFGKAAWHLPRHWHTWLRDDIFQDHSGHQSHIVPMVEAKDMRKHLEAIRGDLPAVLNITRLSSLERAVADIGMEVAPMLDCLNQDTVSKLGSERGARPGVIVDGTMSLLCKRNLFFKWQGLRMLATVLANTENVAQQSGQALEATVLARDDIFRARRTLRDIRRELDIKLRMKVNVAASEELQRLPPRQRGFQPGVGQDTDIIARKYRKAAGEIQQVYLAVVWLDLEFASLDSILKLRQRQAIDILTKISAFEQEQTLSSVKHTLSQGPISAAWEGRMDLLPHRTLSLLNDLNANITTTGEEKGFRQGACDWTKQHMPLHSECTCGHTEKRRTWRTWLDSKEVRIEQAKRKLERYFWHELEHTKIWWDNSTEAGAREDEAETKFRTPDIRTMKFCRAAGDKERPFNPR